MPSLSDSGAASSTCSSGHPSKEGFEPDLSREQRRVAALLQWSRDAFLQRLFSTFPNSWPGVGILLLRCCLATALLDSASTGFLTPPETTPLIQQLAAAATGTFLLVGLWTPVMATLAACTEAWIVLSPYPSAHEDRRIHILLSVLAISIAMLGPGAWSVDARLFGRKRFDIDRARGRRRSL